MEIFPKLMFRDVEEKCSNSNYIQLKLILIQIKPVLIKKGMFNIDVEEKLTEFWNEMDFKDFS